MGGSNGHVTSFFQIAKSRRGDSISLKVLKFFLKIRKIFLKNVKTRVDSNPSASDSDAFSSISGNFDELSHHSDWKRIQPRNIQTSDQ